MIITIKADDVTDKDVLRAFCIATGWTPARPETKKQWTIARLVDYITNTGIRGFIQDTVTAEKDAYIAKLRLQAEAAKTAIVPPTGQIDPTP